MSSKQQKPLLQPLAQTFRVPVLAAVVHSEDEGFEDEGDDDSHHHLAGHGEEEQEERNEAGVSCCGAPEPTEPGQMCPRPPPP